MRSLFSLALATFVSLGCAAGTASRAQETTSDAPILAVLITIDQLRTDYLQKWDSQLTGGLARLVREGAFFVDAVHDHAITETAPGHASIGSGRHPVRTGIAANTAGVADPSVSLLGEPGAGASPRRFRGTTIADWLKASSPRSRVVSVSMKDRGAILPVGREVSDVYWYAPSGRFTTSTYYQRALPQWVQQFNARQLPQKWAGREWNLLLDQTAYPERDSVALEAGGAAFLFPHFMPDDSLVAPQALPVHPWMDELTLGLGLHAVRSLRLGAGGQTDLLAISLSATDIIGHTFGPDSRELHDQILQLDRFLGAFLDTLFTLVDERRVAIALVSDHGVAPFPELSGTTARRVSPSTMLSRMDDLVVAAGGDPQMAAFGSGALSIDRVGLERAGVNVDSLLAAFATFARSVPGVASVDLLSELARRDTLTDFIARRWLHMFEPGQEVELVVTLEPYSIWSYGAGTTHGSPHDYDARVPIVFWGQRFVPGRYSSPARTVDVAPTLARAIGVEPGEPLDGHALTEALR